MPAIVQVIPVIIIIIIDVNVIGGVPVVGPGGWPRVHEHERKAAILEARIPHIHGGDSADAEPVLAAEIETKTIPRNVVAAIAAALPPGAMHVLPLLGAMLLPGVPRLPAASLLPAALLLPG